MPIFEFTCPACSRDHEELMPFKQDVPCPNCLPGEILMQAKVSIPGISFKGGGWAADGYLTPKLRSKDERIK